MQQRAAKGIFASVGTVTAHLSGMFTPLFYTLIIFEAADYITGITSAAKNKNLSSHTAFWGFIKKLFYFIIITVAFLFDLIITETTARLGIDINIPEIFGIMSVCYLLSAEAVSITENLKELDINIPFITKALAVYQEKILKNVQNPGS